MVRDAVPVLIYMLLSAVTVGIIFKAGEDEPLGATPSTTSTNPALNNWTADHPQSSLQHVLDVNQDQAAALWAIFGEFNFMESLHAGSYWFPLLLLLTALLLAIFLTNLMIAQMTSTYEHIRTRSQEYRALQRCEFILEFKDNRSAIPPLFILLWMAYRWLTCNLFAVKKSNEALHRTVGFAVEVSASGRFTRRTHCTRLSCTCLHASLTLRRVCSGALVQVGAEATLRLEERERRYAQAYDEHNRKEARNSVDARLTELLEVVPMINRLCSRQQRNDEGMRRRHEALEDRVDALTTTMERLVALQPKRSRINSLW